jgi:SAM-dependent methyltransferase
MTPTVTMLRPALWDLSQKIFGADDEKKRLYFEPLGIDNSSSTILDFGCATGNTAAPFADYDYTGIDIDPALIDYARFKFRGHPSMKFVADDVTRYEPERPFDYILFAGVAHHLDDELLPKILLRLRTFLSDKGHIYFVDPVITGREGRRLRFLMKADQGKFHRPAAAYESLFERIGFKILEKRALHTQGTLFPQPEYAFFKLR